MVLWFYCGRLFRGGIEMKVKIFKSNDSKNLEDVINEFIRDKAVIDIKYQSMSIANRYNGHGVPVNVEIIDRALIMYVDEEES